MGEERNIDHHVLADLVRGEIALTNPSTDGFVVFPMPIQFAKSRHGNTGAPRGGLEP